MRYTPNTALPAVNKSDVRTAPITTSPHSSATPGKNLNMKANRTVIIANEISHATVSITACDGDKIKCRYLLTADVQAVKTSDATRTKPAPSTSAREISRSITRFNRPWARLQVR